MQFWKKRVGKVDQGRHAGAFLSKLGLLAVAAALLWSQAPSPAVAQTPILPADLAPIDFSAVDANGVDVSNRTLSLSHSISIGDPEKGGLQYSVVYSNSLWRFYNSVRSYAQFDRVIDPDTYSEQESWALTVFGKTEYMAYTGTGTYVGDLGSRMTICTSGAMCAASAVLADGTVAEFSPTPIGVSTTGTAFMITSLTSPSGERTQFYYNGAGFGPSVITTSRGYQLRFEGVTSAQGRHPSSVVLFNMAVDPCDPNAASCPAFTKTWPRLSFEYGANTEPSAVTDTGGARTAYTYGATSKEIELAAGPGVRSVAYTYQDCGPLPPHSYCNAGNEMVGGYRVSTVTRAGRTWTYAWEPGLAPPGGREHGTRVTTAAGSVKYRSAVALSYGNAFGDIYLPASRVIETTDELGRKTKISYVGLLNPRASKITYPEQNGVEHVYDLRGRITKIRTFPKPNLGLADQVATITYGEEGPGWDCVQSAYCNKPILIRNARGHVVRQTWNTTSGLLESVETGLQGPDDNLTCALGAGLCPKTRNEYGSFSAYYKNGSGQLIAGPAMSLLTSSAACPAGTACAASDEIVTTLDYGAPGAANNLQVRSQSVGKSGQMATTAYAYNAVGDRTQIDGPRTDVADITNYEWDLDRRPTLVALADNSATKTSYNAEGLVESEARGVVSGGVFNAMQTTSYLYDTGGNRIRATSPSGVTQFSYDNVGRRVCTAVRMSAAIPADPCTPAVVGDEGPDRISHNTYDDVGQVTVVTTGLGTAIVREESHAYTLNGKEQSVTDGNGNLTTYEYDGFDRLAKVRYPNTSGGGSSTTDYDGYCYDVNNNRTTWRRRDAGADLDCSVATFTFDALDRANNGLRGETYAYDTFGRRTSAALGGATASVSYDALGRIKTETTSSRVLTYEYDPAGNRTRITWPDSFAVSYEWNAAGAMTVVKQIETANATPVTLATYGYDNLGRVTSLTRGNGVTTSYSYDAASRVACLSHAATCPDAAATWSFTYNPADQVRTRTANSSLFEWFGSHTSRTYEINGLNQYAKVGVLNYRYNGRGNLTCTAFNTSTGLCEGGGYGYDAANNLTSVTVDGAAKSLSYDPTGRLEVVSGASVTRLLYSGSDVVAEYDGGGALLRRHVPGAGVDAPLVSYQGSGAGGRRWLLADPQGSIVSMVTDSGGSAAINTYDEYGIPWTGNQGLFQYTGQIWLPEVGLYHYKARAYSPTLGRFLQTDPIGYKDGLNWYAYVGNDPLNHIDDDGQNRRPVAPPVSGMPRTVAGLANAAQINNWNARGRALDPNYRGYSYVGEPTAAGVRQARESFGRHQGRMADEKGVTLAGNQPGAQYQTTTAGALQAQSAEASQGPRYARGALREQVLDKGRQADGTVVCSYCQNATTRPQSDHIVAYSRGGGTFLENLTPACPTCNASKGARNIWEEWLPPRHP